VAAGEYIQASGVWETHREHGRQFRAIYRDDTGSNIIRHWSLLYKLSVSQFHHGARDARSTILARVSAKDEQTQKE